MTRKTSSLLLGVAALAAIAGFAAGQGKYRERPHDGPYRVVLSKPIVGLSYTAGSLYREHEYLSALFNRLHDEGLVPIMTNVTTQTLEGREDEQRMLIVCRKP